MRYDIKEEVMEMVVDQESEPLEAYIGPFTFEVVNDKLINLKQFLKENEPDQRKFKRVYSVLVETLDNVMKHSKKDEQNPESALLLYKEGERYSIYVGNFVEKEDGATLKERIDYLMSRTTDELKQMKLTQLREGKISEKGGAGLGLIDIAMKISRNISCKVKMLQRDDYLLVMVINII